MIGVVGHVFHFAPADLLDLDVDELRWWGDRALRVLKLTHG